MAIGSTLAKIVLDVKKKSHHTVLFAPVILIAIFHIILVYSKIDPTIRMILSDIEAILIGLGTTVVLFVAAQRTKTYSPSIAKAWLFIGFAQLANLVGDTVWAIFEVGLGISPYPSIADIVYLFYYPLFFIAILLFPAHKYISLNRAKRTIDLITIFIGALAIFWNYILGPIISISADAPLVEQILAYAYPIGDLILLWSIILLIYNRLYGRYSGPTILLAIGVLFMVVTDIVFSIQTLEETYVSGSLLDSGWIFQNLLVWSAGIWQILIAQKNVQTEKITTTLTDAVNTLFSYIPLVGLLALVGMFFHSTIKSLPMNQIQIFIVTLALGLTVIIRQIVTNLETKNSFVK